MDSRFRACCQILMCRIEIATPPLLSFDRKTRGLAMTKNQVLCHCEERSDEAISCLATNPFAGMTQGE